MAKRKIIKIDEEKCTGCGLCIPNCPEGALQIIDNKARLISDLFCDGLGACIGHCPEGAINIEEREAEKYDERKVMENIIKQGKNVIKAHLKHLKDHNEEAYLKQAVDVLKNKGIKVPSLEESAEAPGHSHGFSGCPDSRVMDLGEKEGTFKKEKSSHKGISRLRQWPVQISLVPVNAPYFKEADLLIAADCVPFAYPDFHDELLKGKILLVGCPKLDDTGAYQEKITQILKSNNIRSATYAHMEVPCCFGLVGVIKTAISGSGKKIPFKEVTVSIRGELL
ncbi:MAG: 4Fe-4S ferredoxin [Candidatus Omnitrophica bacterium CG07_land_8_20_14_0_80_42_15]|uniref:4Fe-4S ferredoxin n=1 Tax=Candidatus Aquitaenariimonas noxiae TaxID=1974741 RepID=A0A2J0KQJ9_9BACT|nr:MAG: 4Fe-4S ferredoxin [Candidatus Omnitrophica bacterium CG07_land_8_20_14_0_80_42_15]